MHAFVLCQLVGSCFDWWLRSQAPAQSPANVRLLAKGLIATAEAVVPVELLDPGFISVKSLEHDQRASCSRLATIKSRTRQLHQSLAWVVMKKPVAEGVFLDRLEPSSERPRQAHRAMDAQPQTKWTWLRRHGAVFGNVFLLLAFFALDVRDLYFKIAWLGPYDSYAFSAVGIMRIESGLLSPVAQLPNPGEAFASPSGWRSFLQKCEGLQGSGFFLEVMGKNCSVGDPRHPKIVENLLLSSSIRVDSVAWACCKLLHRHRRPGICQDRMVKRFLARYKIEEQVVPVRAIARVDSPAERELLALLDVISRSAPSYQVVCVQAFEHHGKGTRLPNIFGCGNPSLFESAFAGFSALHLSEILQDKAWLTCDVLSVLALQFVIRQNNRSIFTIDDSNNGVVTGEHRTLVNFSASGQLYTLAIMIDICLTTLHSLSAIEIVKSVLLPVLKSGKGHGQGEIRGDKSCFSIFSRSLCRSRPVVALTIVTHLLSWLIILPNAVVWTWSSSKRGKLLAYLSSIRVWVLLLISVHMLWDGAVFASERWAYRFIRKTYLTTAELMAIGAVVAFLNRADLFSMGEKKYALERQRWVDASSFNFGSVGFANAYDDDRDGCGAIHGQLSTNFEVLHIVYGPLLRILARSILLIFGYLVFKMVFLHWKRRETRASQLSTSSCVRYKRLPPEVLLRVPVRAKSIIRSSYELEIETSGAVFVPESLLFDFGILIDRKAGCVLSRLGFLGDVVPPLIEIGDDATTRGAPVGATGPTVSFTTHFFASQGTFSK